MELEANRCRAWALVCVKFKFPACLGHAMMRRNVVQLVVFIVGN